MSIAIEIIICGIEHASPNDKMLHGPIKWLLKKSRPPITLREKYYLLAFTKIGDLIKNNI